MTLLEEFGRLLEELGLGTYGGPTGDIFLRASPPAPDACLVVSRYPGSESDSENPYDEVLFQVRVRGATDDETAVEERAQDVYDAIHGLAYRSLAGGTYLELAVGAQGGPIPVGVDGEARPFWTVNFRCDLQRSTANRP